MSDENVDMMSNFWPYHQVVGIEMNASAVSDAQRNAKINGIENCRFVCGKVCSSFVHLKDIIRIQVDTTLMEFFFLCLSFLFSLENL